MHQLRAALALCLALALPAHAARPDSVFLGVVLFGGYESALTELGYQDGYEPLRAGRFDQWEFSFDNTGIHARLVEDFTDMDAWQGYGVGVYLEPSGYSAGQPFIQCSGLECPERLVTVRWSQLPYGAAGTDKIIVPFALVPEPATVAMMLAGLLLLGWKRFPQFVERRSLSL